MKLVCAITIECMNSRKRVKICRNKKQENNAIYRIELKSLLYEILKIL